MPRIGDAEFRVGLQRGWPDADVAAVLMRGAAEVGVVRHVQAVLP
jgi:hypothetical protein